MKRSQRRRINNRRVRQSRRPKELQLQLPPNDVSVDLNCRHRRHTIVLRTTGELKLMHHENIASEEAMEVMTGQTCRCLDILQIWREISERRGKLRTAHRARPGFRSRRPISQNGWGSIARSKLPMRLRFWADMVDKVRRNRRSLTYSGDQFASRVNQRTFDDENFGDWITRRKGYIAMSKFVDTGLTRRVMHELSQTDAYRECLQEKAADKDPSVCIGTVPRLTMTEYYWREKGWDLSVTIPYSWLRLYRQGRTLQAGHLVLYESDGKYVPCDVNRSSAAVNRFNEHMSCGWTHVLVRVEKDEHGKLDGLTATWAKIDANGLITWGDDV